LSDLPVVEKSIPTTLMNCDNQIVITKVNSAKDNAKSTRLVKRSLKTVRLRNFGVITVSYIQTDKKPGRSLYKRAITECDRNCI
jgi:hypothetical protein